MLPLIGEPDIRVDHKTGLLTYDNGVQRKRVPRYIELNVQDYGAVADGSTDDSAAIAAAVADLPYWGGRIIIPASPRPYHLDSGITFYRSNVEILIEDGAWVEKDPATTALEAFTFQGSTPSGWDDLTADPSAGDVEIVVTTPANFSAGDWIMVKDAAPPWSGSGTHWEFNRVRSKSGSTLTLEYPLTDDFSTISTVAPSACVVAPSVNCGIVGGGKVTNGDPADSTKGNAGVKWKWAVGGYCRGIEFEYCQQDAVRIFDSYCCEVSGTYCHDSNNFAGSGRGITIGGSTHVIASNNRLVRLRHSTDVSNFCRHVLIQGNVCRGSGETMFTTHPDVKHLSIVGNVGDGAYGFSTGAEWGTSGAVAPGVAIGANNQHVLVAGNKLSNIQGTGIVVQRDLCADVIVRDNTVTAANLYGNAVNFAGIGVWQLVATYALGDGIAVENNDVRACVGRGIVAGASNMVVRGNTVRGTTSAGSDSAGILVRPWVTSGTPDPISDVLVEGNVCDDGSDYGIKIGYSSSVIVNKTVVKRNACRNNAKSGIYAIPEQVDGLAIEDNTTHNNNTANATAQGGIVVGVQNIADVSAADVIVSRNTSLDDVGRAIQCNVSGAKITENKVYNATVMGIYVPCGATGQSSLDVLVRGNLVVNCPQGIYVGDTTYGTVNDAVIRNNDLIGCTNGIRLRSRADGTKLIGNATWNCTTEVLDESSTNTQIVSHYDPDSAQIVFGAATSAHDDLVVVEGAFRANDGAAYARDEVTTGTTTVDKNHHYIYANTVGGNVTLNLPATDASGVGVGKEYTFKKIGSNTLAINPSGSNTIEGASSWGADMVGGDSVTIRSNGGAGASGNWDVVSDRWSQTKKISEKFKTADEIVNNSSTLQDDDALSLSLSASTVYRFEIEIFWSTNTTANFKFIPAFTGTMNANYYISEFSVPNADTSTRERVEPSGWQQWSAAGTGETHGYALLKGVIDVNASGTFKLQWAQSVADASDTKVLRGSRLKVQEVA